MYSTFAIFVSTIAALLGLLLLPFGVIGSDLVLGVAVLLLGGGVAYAGWLLYRDDFSTPTPESFKSATRYALISGSLSLIGQIALRHFFGYTGTMIYSFLLVGGFETSPLSLILFALTTVLGVLSVLPLFILAMDGVDTSYHDFCRITYVNHVEERREYFSQSTERGLILLIALASAIVAALSGHIVILLIVLGINLYLAMPTQRTARAAGALTWTAAALCFLATLGSLPYEMAAISLAMDIMPLLYFGLILLIYALYKADRIYKVGITVLLFGGFLPLWLLSFGISALLSFIFPLPSSFALYTVLAFLAVALFLILRAIPSVKAAYRQRGEENRRAGRRLLFRLTVLTLLLAMLLSVCLGSGLIPAVDLVWSGPAPKVSYSLREDKTFTVDGVLYGISDKGIIALKVVDTEAESIRIVGYQGRYDEATPAAAESLKASGGEYGRTIYAVATGFLEDNDNIKTLSFDSYVTLRYFDTACITGCDALETVSLRYAVATAVKGARADAEDAFDLAKETKFEVGNLEHIYDYYATLAPTVGRRLVYAKDVYYRVSMGVSYSDPGLADCKLSYVSSRFSATANVFGVKRISLECSTDETVGRASAKVFSAGERVICRDVGSATVSYGTAGSIYQSAWILNAYHSFGGSGSATADTALFRLERSHSGEANCTVSLSGYLTYDAPK